MIFGFLVKMENTITIHSYSTPCIGPFSIINDALPLNSLFWSPPTAVHRFDAWDIAVPGLYISCLIPCFCFWKLNHFHWGFLFKWLVQISTTGAIKDWLEKNQMKVQRVVITGHNSWKCIGLIQWLTI